MIEQLLGKTIIDILYKTNPSVLTIYCLDGESFVFHHSQDCCESVHLEDGLDDLQTLVNDGPIFLAEETTNKHDEGGDVILWTYQKLSTAHGSVSLRWLGSSNGYYSMGVDIYKDTHDKPNPSKSPSNSNRFSNL